MLTGWLNEVWFLTALPQRFNPFRQSSPNIQLYATIQDGKLEFCEKNKDGVYIKRGDFYKIEQLKLNEQEQQRLWLNRNYYRALQDIDITNTNEFEDVDKKMYTYSKRYGEIMLPEYYSEQRLIYSDQFGLVLFQE